MTINVTEADGIVELSLSRPPMNALDIPTIVELEQLFRHHTAHLPEKGLVLSGEGKAFCAGVDTKIYGGYTAADRRVLVRAITRLVAAIYQFPLPLVTAVNGHATGGGFVLILSGDYRLAADDAGFKFGLTEAQAGVPFPIGPTEIIRSEMPASLLRQLSMTSRIVGVEELLRHGVIDRLVPGNKLRDEARLTVSQLAAQPAFQSVKQQIRGPLAKTLQALSDSGVDPFVEHFL